MRSNLFALYDSRSSRTCFGAFNNSKSKSSDTTKINGIALSMFGILIETIVTLLMGLIVGFIFSWQLTLLCIGFLPLMMFASAIHIKLKMGAGVEDELAEKQAGTILSECMINTKSIFCYNFQSKAVELYSDVLERNKKSLCSLVVNGLLTGLSQFMMYGVYACVFYVGGILIKNQSIDFGQMMRAIFAVLFAAFGVGQAQQYVGDYKAAQEALVNLFKVINSHTLINPYEKEKIKVEKQSFNGKIEFIDVKFSYPTRPNELILKGISFVLNPGQSAGIVGFSGSGKSTIIQLILRFYDIDSGEILIDGKDIKEYDLLSLRKCIGLVMQEPVLFKQNIYQNILYGDLNANYDDVINAAKEAKVPRIEQISPENENVLPVSGGEKQRIAIARCILKNPKILLLDEASSALDKKTEVLVQESLDNLMKGRTSLAIAHRYL